MSEPYVCFACALGFALVACGRPTGDEVIERTAQPICEKIQECAGDTAFEKAYPGGVDECKVRTIEGVRSKRDDLDKRSVCTDEEVEQCIRDFKAVACPEDLDDLKPPCNC